MESSSFFQGVFMKIQVSIGSFVKNSTYPFDTLIHMKQKRRISLHQTHERAQATEHVHPLPRLSINDFGFGENRLYSINPKLNLRIWYRWIPGTPHTCLYQQPHMSRHPLL